MIDGIILFSLMAILASFLGYTGLAVGFVGLSECLIMVFTLLFIASMVYSSIVASRESQA